MDSKARKPYYGLKKSTLEFFNEPVRYLKQSVQMESAFEKPYRDGEYPKMHLNLPSPSWPDWNFGFPSGVGGGGPTEKGEKKCEGCGLHFPFAPPSDECESEPIEFSASEMCSIYNGSETISKGAVNVGGVLVALDGYPKWGSLTIVPYAVEGAIARIEVGHWTFLGPSLDVYVNPDIEKHYICGRMNDGSGGFCEECIEVTCEACNCETEPDIAIDTDNTDTTISHAVDAVVTVINGCGPFTWSVSGKGYTIDPSGLSDSRVATVSCGEAANFCNAEAGAGFAPTCIVTCVDSCGDTANDPAQDDSGETGFVIRNTAGSWSSSVGSRMPTGEGGVYCGTDYEGANASYCARQEGTGDLVPAQYVVSGGFRWKVDSSIYTENHCYVSGDEPIWSVATGTCPLPSWGEDPIDAFAYAHNISGICYSGANQGESCTCWSGGLTYYVWEC